MFEHELVSLIVCTQNKMENFTAVIQCKIVNGGCLKLSAGYCKVAKSADGLLKKVDYLILG
jgi:hypothetical protein